MTIEINRKENVKISLVIPAFNEEKIIDNILSKYDKSLLNKYNAEIILSDGGSADKTVEIAKKYVDKIVIHTEKRRQTIAEGRNCGAELARGEVIVFINSDTYPQNVEMLLEYVASWVKNTRSVALATRVYVSPEDKIFSDVIFYNCFNAYVRFLNIIGVGMCRGECQIVRREVFEKVGGYKNEYAAGEDFDLFNRIAKIGKTEYTNKITVIESPRRFRQDGYIKVLWQWFKNAMGVLINKQAADKEWKAVR